MVKPELLSSFPASPLNNKIRTPGDGARNNLIGNDQGNAKVGWSGTNETPSEEISAYFKLESEWFTYYCQKLAVTIGRRVAATEGGAEALLPPCKTVTLTGDHSDSSSLGSSPAGTEALSTVIDVDLGQLKSISRLHAWIQYDEDDCCFTLAVLGRNGAWVDDGWYESGMKVRLTSGSRIQIATCVFYFVLPLPHSLHRPRSFPLLPIVIGFLLLGLLLGTPGGFPEDRAVRRYEPCLELQEYKLPREGEGKASDRTIRGSTTCQCQCPLPTANFNPLEPASGDMIKLATVVPSSEKARIPTNELGILSSMLSHFLLGLVVFLIVGRLNFYEQGYAIRLARLDVLLLLCGLHVTEKAIGRTQVIWKTSVVTILRRTSIALVVLYIVYLLFQLRARVDTCGDATPPCVVQAPEVRTEGAHSPASLIVTSTGDKNNDGRSYPPKSSTLASLYLEASDEINSKMPPAEIIQNLVLHGCRDITANVQTRTCSEFPVANGGFGDVYRGQLNNGTQIAIKCMRIFESPDVEAQQTHLKHAAREIYTWSKLQHPHILSLLGLAEYRGRISMVSPWIQGGPARYHLKRVSKPVDWPLLCMKIADALLYLHQSGVIHGDLKGDNILVSEDTGEPFVTDFGNAVLQEHTLQFAATSSTRQHISSRWTAPEIWHGGLRSFEADIFALGMTILEVITRDVPYAGMGDAAVMFAILKSEHPKRPETHVPSTNEHGDILWSLLEDCWMADPAMRPVAMTVRDKVKGLEHWWIPVNGRHEQMRGLNLENLTAR